MTARRWDRSKPPTGPWALNKDSPQAQNLGFWWPMDGGGGFVPEYVDGKHMALNSAATGRSLGTDGQPVVVFNGTSQTGSVAVNLAPYSGINVAFRLVNDVNSATDKLALEYTANSSGVNNSGGFFINPNSSSAGKAEIYLKTTTDVAKGVDKTFTQPSAGVQHDWLVTLDQSVSGASKIPGAYIDGVSQSLTTALSTGLSGSFANSTLYAMSRGGASLWNNGKLSDLRIYTSIDNAALLALAISDPGLRFDLWYPLRSRKWIVSGGGGSATDLTIQDATHGHAADSLTITVDSTLAIQEATHAHTADNLSLTVTGATDLTIADATHSHTADNLDLTVDGSTDLVIDDATHAHTADNLTIAAEGEATTLGRRGRRERLRKLLDYDVPMPVEVITSTIPSDKVVEPIAAPKVEAAPVKPSRLAKPRPKKPDAPAPEVKANKPEPKPPAAQVQAPEPAKAVAAPRPMMLSDILSAETMTPDEMVAAIKMLARIQLGPQLIRSTPKAKLIRA